MEGISIYEFFEISKILIMKKLINLVLVVILILTGFSCKDKNQTDTYKADVIVYGGTSAAVTTAVQVTGWENQ